jgi:fructose-1,6-bisphosphatase/inositol monophosphatase family enzyme
MTTILGNADAYVYDRLGLKQWDTCGGEALIKSRGGVITDLQNHPVPYKTQTLIKGCICSRTKFIHQLILSKLKKIPF